MASLRKRGGVWHVRLSIGRDPETGRYRFREVSTGKTSRADAEVVAARITANAADGILPSTSRDTFAQFLHRWLEDYVRPNLAPSTIASYENAVAKHISPALGSCVLRDLTPDMLARYYARKLREGRADGKEGGLSPSKVLYHHRIIHKALSSAVKWGLVPRNVADAVDAPKLRRPRRPVLLPEEVRRLLDAVRTDQLYPLYYMALHIGLREGELVAIRWSGFDAANRTLAVERALSRQTGKGVVEGPTKATRPYSRVHLSDEAVKVLKTHRERQEREKALGGYREDHGLIFCWEDGLPIDPAIVSKHFRRLRDRLGLPAGMHFHDLRHTSATIGAARGEPLKVIQERLGHESPTTTLAMYGHATDPMHQDWADRMGQTLGSVEAADTQPAPRRRHRLS